MQNNINELNMKAINKKELSMDELEKVAGGIHRMPLLPGSRRHHRIDTDLIIKDEPKDGGATGGW